MGRPNAGTLSRAAAHLRKCANRGSSEDRPDQSDCCCSNEERRCVRRPFVPSASRRYADKQWLGHLDFGFVSSFENSSFVIQSCSYSDHCLRTDRPSELAELMPLVDPKTNCFGDAYLRESRARSRSEVCAYGIGKSREWDERGFRFTNAKSWRVREIPTSLARSSEE